MKIATWNVNSLKVRLPQILDWLRSTNCDVLALQELKMSNEGFPVQIFKDYGYNCVFNGQKTYNGVAIIAKSLPVDICYDIPNYDDLQKRVIAATIDKIRIICVYVVNGESKSSDKFIYKLSWLEQLHNYISSSITNYKKLVLLGDFNIAPEEIDVYDPTVWEDQVLFTKEERIQWFRLIKLGLYDSFRIFHKNEANQYSWWDYRNFAFKRKAGLRIDHILISDEVKKIASACEIDTTPRKNQRPSDHAPVILTLDL